MKKTISLFMALTAYFFFGNICLSPPVSAGARIDVVVDHGVDNEAETQARAAITAIIDFFYNTYGLSLERDIRISLVPDKNNFKEAMKRWYGASEDQARFEAERAAGLQSRGTIIVDLGDRPKRYGRLFTLCHEIVHLFQAQESNDRHGAIGWMCEGVADAIAAHILENIGLGCPGGYKNQWTEILQKARSCPSLEILHTHQGLMAACYTYGPTVTYETSAMAVLTLVQWRGYKPLFAYFSALKQRSPEDAFYQAFGSRVGDFEKQFRPF
jgi:hypothetical protein